MVTHSPQVAALGGHHWRVEKRVAKGQTLSTVTPLGADERIEEIARMLAGDKVTEAAREAARALLAAACAALPPGAPVIVTGCAAQTEPETFAAMPEVARVVGNHEKMQAETWKGITAPDLKELKIIDRIIGEPVGGAHADRDAAIKSVGDALIEELDKMSKMSPGQIRKARADRFYAIGRAG